MNKPRVGTVLEVLYKIQIKGLTRIISNSRVCSEQQDSYSNKSIAFHGKL